MRYARIIGQKIKQLCEKNNVSTSELCKKMNYSEYDLQCLFSGQKYASFQQLVEISDVLQVSVSEIIAERDVDISGKDEILDIIDEYIDIKNSVS